MNNRNDSSSGEPSQGSNHGDAVITIGNPSEQEDITEAAQGAPQEQGTEDFESFPGVFSDLLTRRRSTESFFTDNDSSGRQSFASLRPDVDPTGEKGPTPGCQAERVQHMAYLMQDSVVDLANTRDGSATGLHIDTTGLDLNTLLSLEKGVEDKRLLELATEFSKKNSLVLSRFERFATLCLFHYQHELVQLEEKLSQNDGATSKMDDFRKIRLLLLEYYEFIWVLSNVQEIKRPNTALTRQYGRKMARRFHEPRYWDSPDALNLFDLSLDGAGKSPDTIRRFLQEVVPGKLLDQTGRDIRALKKEKASKSTLSGGTADLLRIIQRHPFHVSPAVDLLARLLIAIIGAMFLLVPMIVMTVWPGREQSCVVPLVVTSISMLLFAISISVFTKATNQEVIAASAAYTAVLVVFVGSTAPSQPAQG